MTWSGSLVFQLKPCLYPVIQPSIRKNVAGCVRFLLPAQSLFHTARDAQGTALRDGGQL
jgi:hypothetical protein